MGSREKSGSDLSVNIISSFSNGRLFIPQAGFFSGKNTVNNGDMSVGYYKLVNVKSGKPVAPLRVIKTGLSSRPRRDSLN